MNSCSPPTQPIDSTRLCARFSSTEPRQQRRAERFGYTPGSFRVLCHEFRKNPQREFFLPQTKKAKLPPPRERLRQKIITLRKQNSSVYDIRDALDQSGEKLSPASISTILKEEGFARLPRWRDDERPATTRPNAADVADAGKLDLSERTFRTKVGGLFLFLPYLAKIPLDKMLADAKFPGTKMMPAAHAIRSLLAMKLFGSARHSHVMSYVFDEGLALFAGLNVIPKRSFLTEYSCRIRPVCYPQKCAHGRIISAFRTSANYLTHGEPPNPTLVISSDDGRP